MHLLFASILSISLFSFNISTDKKAQFVYLHCTENGQFSDNLKFKSDSTFVCGSLKDTDKTSMVFNTAEFYTSPKAFETDVEAFFSGEWDLAVKDISFTKVSHTAMEAWLVNCTFENNMRLKTLIQRSGSK